MNNLVSVIVPVYNHAHTISKTVRSIMAQTHQPLEVIIVDDGSTDAFPQKVAQLQSKYSCTIITLAHGGAARARNAGFLASRGEHVLFWDADTIAHPSFISKLLSALAANPQASFAYSRFKFGLKTMRSQPYDPGQLAQGNYIDTTSLIKRSALHGVPGPFDEKLQRFQDWDLWLTLRGLNKTGIFVPEVLFKKIVAGRAGISRWLPKWFYSLAPRNRAVIKYHQAVAIVLQKHGLPNK